MVQRQADSLAVRFVLSGAAASCAETVTYPIDFLKTRLQLQAETPGAALSGVPCLPECGPLPALRLPACQSARCCPLPPTHTQPARNVCRGSSSRRRQLAAGGAWFPQPSKLCAPRGCWACTLASPPLCCGTFPTLAFGALLCCALFGFCSNVMALMLLYKCGTWPTTLLSLLHCCRVLVFEQLRNAAQRRLHPGGAGPGEAAPALPLPINLVLGLTAGALGQAAAVPADLVKVSVKIISS